MPENKILKSRAAKLAKQILQAQRRLRHKVFKFLLGRPYVASGVYPLRLPLLSDTKIGWQPFSLFRGATAGMREVECHASLLIPGYCPHSPHRHKEEELLLILSGEVDIILPDVAGKPEKVRRHLKAGEFVYYPRYFAHTLETTSDAVANYLMFKWYSSRHDDTGLAFGSFDMAPAQADSGSGNGFCPQRIFMGRTTYLNKLECHFTALSPQAGNTPHADAYDVAIVVLEGQVETLGKPASPYDVIFYASGEPHDMRNLGKTAAKYLVFEFHPRRAFFSPRRGASV